MPKQRLFLCILLMGLLFLCSCQHPDHGTKLPSNDSLANSPINYLYFSESNSYFKRVQGYEFHDENGKYTVYFHLANEETAYPITVDQEWANTLKSCIEQYGIMRWNGFKGSARNLLDGTHFFIEFTFEDGTEIRASGYGQFPEGYGDASSAIDAHFMQLLPENMRDW